MTNINDRRTLIEVRHEPVQSPVEFIETVQKVESQNEPDDSLYECYECNECETCDESIELNENKAENLRINLPKKERLKARKDDSIELNKNKTDIK